MATANRLNENLGMCSCRNVLAEAAVPATTGQQKKLQKQKQYMRCKTAHRHTKPYHYLKHFPTEIYVCAINRPPPESIPDPWGCKTNFLGAKIRFEDESLYVLGCVFSKETRFLKGCKVLYCPKKHCPAQLFQLTLVIQQWKLLNTCIAIYVSR